MSIIFDAMIMKWIKEKGMEKIGDKLSGLIIQWFLG